MQYYLAIDIGASSGRHIIGWRENGQIKTREIYRFPNGVHTENGHLVWDIDGLFTQVLQGIQVAFRECPKIESLSVDTWGVDYVLLEKDEPIRPVYAYRDSRTEAVIGQVHEKVSFEELYCRTGCQFRPFNTIYQIYDDKIQGRLDRATQMLMLPEYLMYRLTGVAAREYTNASTTGMISAKTGEYDPDILNTLGYPTHLFPKLTQPGTVLGELLPEIREQVGGNCKVVLCATHDTGSAVEGIPMEQEGLYLSSGTWSLLGVKTLHPITDTGSRLANYSNEGGVGYNRYQKNIMGMWLINQLQQELCPETPISRIVEMAEQSRCEALVDADAPEFLAPESMVAAFNKAAGMQMETGDYFRCAFRSLAISYQKAIRQLEENTGSKYDCLYIVGGGAKNKFLNRLTEELTGKKVVALPIEATALGNLKIQMEV